MVFHREPSAAGCDPMRSQCCCTVRAVGRFGVAVGRFGVAVPWEGLLCSWLLLTRQPCVSSLPVPSCSDAAFGDQAPNCSSQEVTAVLLLLTLSFCCSCLWGQSAVSQVCREGSVHQQYPGQESSMALNAMTEPGQADTDN